MNPLPRNKNMTLQEEKMPHPDECKWCAEARNCTTKWFNAKDLLDPLPQPGQTQRAYLESLCECGHQLIPSFDAEAKDIPETLQHTTLCKEHTIRWMATIIDLKLKFNRNNPREKTL